MYLFCVKTNPSESSNGSICAVCLPERIQAVHYGVYLEGRCGVCGLGHEQGQRFRYGTAEHHGGEAEIHEKVYPLLVCPDAEALKYAAEEPGLLFAEDAVALGREPPEDELLFLDRQHRNAVLLAVAAGVQKAPHGLAPAQRGVGHQAARVLEYSRLLEIERLDDEVLLGGEEGVEKAPRDAHGPVYLFHGGVLYALPRHQLQRDGDQLAANALALGLGIGYLRHPDPP